MTIAKAQTLLRNGYQVVPIVQEVGKPCIKNCMDDWYEEKDAIKWINQFSDAGLALVAGKNDVYGLDFDIDNKAFSKKMMNVVLKNFPGVALRQCNKPRFAILFKASGDEIKELSNGYSTSYTTGVKGSVQQIELIGNRTMTIYGNHRKTGNPYKFSRSSKYDLVDPLRTEADDLAELTLSDIKKLFKYFDKNVPSDFNLLKESSLSRKREEVTFENVRVQKRYADSEVEDLLSRSIGNDYHSWTKVGMALHQHYDGSVEGLNRWDEWSSEFDGYEPDACRAKWETFDADGGVTMGSIAKDVRTKEEGTPEERYERFRRENVLIVRGNTGNGGSMIANLSDSPVEALKKYDEAAKEYQYMQMEVPGQTPTGTPTMKMMKFLDLFMSDPDRVAVHSLMYYPSRNRIVKPRSKEYKKRYYNLYRPPNVEMTIATDMLPKFTDMIEYLFNEEGANWFYNWLAQIVQQPTRRMPIAPLHISTFHGTGRGWVTEVVKLLVGTGNTTSSKMDTIMDSPFTPYFEESVLCVVEETYAKREKRYEVDDKLRGLIGGSMQEINVKFVKQSTSDVFTRFWLQSNHVDALVIDDLDRRIQPFYCHKKPLANSVYLELYGLIGGLNDEDEPDQRFLNQVYSFLMNWEVDMSLLQRSIHTPDRQQLIDSTKSITAQAFFAFKQVVGTQLFYDTQMQKFIARYSAEVHNDTMIAINDKEIGALNRNHVAETHRFRFKTPIVVKSFEYRELGKMNVTDVKKSLQDTNQTINLYFTQLTEKQDEN